MGLIRCRTVYLCLFIYFAPNINDSICKTDNFHLALTHDGEFAWPLFGGDDLQ